MTSITRTWHTRPYPTIDPANNPHAGKTVLVTGSSAGIGFAIAHAFVAAHAACVIVTGRRPNVLNTAIISLEQAAAASVLLPETPAVDAPPPAATNNGFFWSSHAGAGAGASASPTSPTGRKPSHAAGDSRSSSHRSRASSKAGASSKQQQQQPEPASPVGPPDVSAVAAPATGPSSNGGAAHRRTDSPRDSIDDVDHLPATKIVGCKCDISDPDSVKVLWAELRAQDLVVDVLVLNASPAGSVPAFKDGLMKTWGMFEAALLANMRFVDRFLAQGLHRSKVIINISSGAAHISPLPGRGSYAASKAAAASMFQYMADEYDPHTLQIINLHPGSVYTEAGVRAGIAKDSRPWDSEELPGAFCVWAATRKASFLHGRFVWVNWDADELVGMRDRLKHEPGLLRVGLQGVDPVTSMSETLERMKAAQAKGL